MLVVVLVLPVVLVRVLVVVLVLVLLLVLVVLVVLVLVALVVLVGVASQSVRGDWTIKYCSRPCTRWVLSHHVADLI